MFQKVFTLTIGKPYLFAADVFHFPRPSMFSHWVQFSGAFGNTFSFVTIHHLNMPVSRRRWFRSVSIMLLSLGGGLMGLLVAGSLTEATLDAAKEDSKAAGAELLRLPGQPAESFAPPLSPSLTTRIDIQPVSNHWLEGERATLKDQDTTIKLDELNSEKPEASIYAGTDQIPSADYSQEQVELTKKNAGRKERKSPTSPLDQASPSCEDFSLQSKTAKRKHSEVSLSTPSPVNSPPRSEVSSSQISANNIPPLLQAYQQQVGIHRQGAGNEGYRYSGQHHSSRLLPLTYSAERTGMPYERDLSWPAAAHHHRQGSLQDLGSQREPLLHGEPKVIPVLMPGYLIVHPPPSSAPLNAFPPMPPINPSVPLSSPSHPQPLNYHRLGTSFHSHHQPPPRPTSSSVSHPAESQKTPCSQEPFQSTRKDQKPFSEVRPMKRPDSSVVNAVSSGRGPRARNDETPKRDIFKEGNKNNNDQEVEVTSNSRTQETPVKDHSYREKVIQRGYLDHSASKQPYQPGSAKGSFPNVNAPEFYPLHCARNEMGRMDPEKEALGSQVLKKALGLPINHGGDFPGVEAEKPVLRSADHQVKRRKPHGLLRSMSLPAPTASYDFSAQEGQVLRYSSNSKNAGHDEQMSQHTDSFLHDPYHTMKQTRGGFRATERPWADNCREESESRDRSGNEDRYSFLGSERLEGKSPEGKKLETLNEEGNTKSSTKESEGNQNQVQSSKTSSEDMRKNKKPFEKKENASGARSLEGSSSMKELLPEISTKRTGHPSSEYTSQYPRLTGDKEIFNSKNTDTKDSRKSEGPQFSMKSKNNWTLLSKIGLHYHPKTLSRNYSRSQARKKASLAIDDISAGCVLPKKDRVLDQRSEPRSLSMTMKEEQAEVSKSEFTNRIVKAHGNKKSQTQSSPEVMIPSNYVWRKSQNNFPVVDPSQFSMEIKSKTAKRFGDFGEKKKSINADLKPELNKYFPKTDYFQKVSNKSVMKPKKDTQNQNEGSSKKMIQHHALESTSETRYPPQVPSEADHGFQIIKKQMNKVHYPDERNKKTVLEIPENCPVGSKDKSSSKEKGLISTETGLERFHGEEIEEDKTDLENKRVLQGMDHLVKADVGQKLGKSSSLPTQTSSTPVISEEMRIVSPLGATIESEEWRKNHFDYKSLGFTEAFQGYVKEWLEETHNEWKLKNLKRELVELCVVILHPFNRERYHHILEIDSSLYRLFKYYWDRETKQCDQASNWIQSKMEEYVEYEGIRRAWGFYFQIKQHTNLLSWKNGKERWMKTFSLEPYEIDALADVWGISEGNLCFGTIYSASPSYLSLKRKISHFNLKPHDLLLEALGVGDTRSRLRLLKYSNERLNPHTSWWDTRELRKECRVTGLDLHIILLVGDALQFGSSYLFDGGPGRLSAESAFIQLVKIMTDQSLPLPWIESLEHNWIMRNFKDIYEERLIQLSNLVPTQSINAKTKSSTLSPVMRFIKGKIGKDLLRNNHWKAGDFLMWCASGLDPVKMAALSKKIYSAKNGTPGSLESLNKEDQYLARFWFSKSNNMKESTKQNKSPVKSLLEWTDWLSTGALRFKERLMTNIFESDEFE